MSTENIALVRKWFEEVWNKGRVGAIDELLASHAVVHGLGADLRGPAGFKSFHSAYRDAFPDVMIQIDDIVAQGDIVAARWSGTGTHRGEGLGSRLRADRCTSMGWFSFVSSEANWLKAGITSTNSECFNNSVL